MDCSTAGQVLQRQKQAILEAVEACEKKMERAKGFEPSTFTLAR